MSSADPGFAVHPRVFDRPEMQQVLAALDRADLTRTKAGARHVLAVPAVRAVASERRLVDLAAHYVGPSPVPFRATLFDKSSAANWLVAWHQDTALPLRRRVEDPAWGPWSTKAGVLYAHAPPAALASVVALRVSLDDSTPTNGPLRVLPESHRYGVLSDEAIARLATDTRPVACLASSGGVVAMRPLTVHASSKATDDRPRRVLHIEYAAAVRFGDAELAVE